MIAGTQSTVSRPMPETNLRSADTVMRLERLGCLYPYPLSFMRSLVRTIFTQEWDIVRTRFELDDQGFGEAIYQINSPGGQFHFVVFSHYLAPEERSDRVIAEKWDMTATLCAGELTEARLSRLRANVPLQEAGRVDPECIVLTRANKSSRNFKYVVDCLAEGQQPELDVIAKVGYLFRTTAVYGSGKFGMADWEKICLRYPVLAKPFMAEMLGCYLIRQFSLELADWVAAQKNSAAVKLSDEIKRYFGIGNATGLGMAPYLINHPKLICNWIEVRERALRRVYECEAFDAKGFDEFSRILEKAIRHLGEIDTDNEAQNRINHNAANEAEKCLSTMRSADINSWADIFEHVNTNCGHEAQELVNSVLLEVHADKILDLESELYSDEKYRLDPRMRLGELRSVIETHYDWAISEDYSANDCLDTFWYRSEEKSEPRLGRRSLEPGAEKEMLLGIGWRVRSLYDRILTENSPDQSVARFVFNNPQFRYITRRVQTLAASTYGDIRDNLLHADVQPIHLLRCKLSFFGVGKFDPKSRLWVRNTMFQGAPVLADLNKPFQDDWYFPVKPAMNP